MSPATLTNDSNIARRIAKAVSAFELRTEGHVPESVTVISSGRTLVISMEGALSSIEQSLVQSASGAAHVQEFYQQMFTKPPIPLWEEIKEITGAEAIRNPDESDRGANTSVKVFADGTVVHVFLLSQPVETSAWNEKGSAREVAETT
ncbi:MAG TPA: Na-translocating system protein MpsC family protein [Phycisphaerae bacterium]|nr:Na-translocating system protein MpsC family protein [Phycisphaerae bacterium]